MATAKKNWSSNTTLLDASTCNSSALLYTDNVDLETNGYEGSYVTVDVAFNSGGTKNVNYYVYGSLDGSNFDDTELFSQQISVSAGNSVQHSCVIKDIANYRMGFSHDEAEASCAEVTIAYQNWNWSIT